MDFLLNSPFKEKSYIVGGHVRDNILNIPSTDVDYVVEATKEEFESYFQLDPVGNDFPVYILEGNEVALTRREKSTGKTYSDFEITEIGVDIIEDLSRRDFTMNSIAINISTGEIVDPFNGVKHIKERKIVTVNKVAFEEDPVRILRAFRFAARFNMSIDGKTFDLITESIKNLKHVTKERIVLELEKAYKQTHNGDQLVRYFEMLFVSGAMEIILNPIHKLHSVTAGPSQYHNGKTALQHTMDAVKRAKDKGYEFHIFMAALFHDTGKGVTRIEILPHHYGHEERSAIISKEFFANHKFSSRVNEFVPKAAALHMRFHLLKEMSNKKLVRFAHDTRMVDFLDLIKVADCDRDLTEDKKLILNTLVDLKKMKLDVEAIKKSKCKKSEVLGQMNSLFKRMRKS